MKICFITNNNQVVNFDEETSLLRVSIRYKAGMPFKCGGGICGTCRCVVKKGMKNTNKLTKEEWLSSIKTITPNLSQILNILEPEFDEVRSIQDIEILLNKYNVSYTDLPNTSSMNIMKKNINTNMKIDSENINKERENDKFLRNSKYL